MQKHFLRCIVLYYLMICCLGICSEFSEQVITKPYEPRHAVMYRFSAKSPLLDVMLTDPAAALKSIIAVQAEAAKRVQDYAQLVSHERYKKEEELGATMTRKHPIFLLNECQKEDFGHCLLSRLHKPHYRQAFETRVTATVHEKLVSLKRPIEYTSFASGDLFQDCVILAKVLAKKPDAQLNIHCVDTLYAPYVACRDLIQDTRIVRSDYTIDPTKVMGAFKAQARDVGRLNLPDGELEEKLVNTCYCLELGPKQLVTWLSKTFPQARLNLYLHDTAKSYLAYIGKHTIQHPDVIITADIEDEMSQLRGAMRDYGELCVRTLQNNPLAKNVWLSKENHGALLTISLAESNNSAKKHIVSLASNEEIAVEIDMEKIG